MKKTRCIIAFAAGMLLFANSLLAYDFECGGIYYNVTSYTSPYTVAVTYEYTNGYSYSGNIIIPSSLTYNGITFSVTSIGGAAFYECRGLTSIIIPNSVTSIGRDAFYRCTGLTSITIPNSVTSIGDHAFDDCTGLTSVTIPNSVTSIGNDAFFRCRRLTSVTIPNSVTSIGDGAFGDCTGLTSVTIPNSVTSIGDNAFYECTGLTSVTIPNSVTSIGSGVFYGCTGLTSVTIPNSVTSIGASAFYGCSYIDTIVFKGQNPPSTGDYCFEGVPGLTVIIVPCGRGAIYMDSLSTWFTDIVEDCGNSIAEAENASITLYPNPASDKVTLEGVGNGADIFIINAMGKVVRRLENVGGIITFSVGDLPKGIYFVRVGSAVRKLVID